MLSDQVLSIEAGLDTDGINGFREALRNRRITNPRHIPAPEHLYTTQNSPRLDRFEKGAWLAIQWLVMRQAAARARRKQRADDLRQKGMCYAIDPAQIRAEAIEHLRYLSQRMA